MTCDPIAHVSAIPDLLPATKLWSDNPTPRGAATNLSPRSAGRQTSRQTPTFAIRDQLVRQPYAQGAATTKGLREINANHESALADYKNKDISSIHCNYHLPTIEGRRRAQAEIPIALSFACTMHNAEHN